MLDSEYDEFFAQRYEVNSGKEHPFFGVRVNRDEIPELPEDLPTEVRMKPGTEFNPRDISPRNILRIPELAQDYDEPTVYWYVETLFGKGADLRFVLRPITNVLTGARYILHVGSGILEEKKGLYRDSALDMDNFLGELPRIEPISDYYLCYKTGLTEYLMLDYIEGKYL